MRAGFLNLNLTTTRADLVRAVYEGVAFNAAWLLPHVAALAEASWPAIRFGGGAAASDLWAQILADAVGAEVEQLDGPRTTNARGAAFLALVRLGHISLDDIPAMLKVRGRYVPDPDVSAQYARLVERHVDFHTRNRPFYAALNRGGA
jgi:xylulokinase